MKPTEQEIEIDLRDIKDYYGGWKELKEIISRLEDNDNEAAWERHCTEPDAWAGGFADNH